MARRRPEPFWLSVHPSGGRKECMHTDADCRVQAQPTTTRARHGWRTSKISDNAPQQASAVRTNAILLSNGPRKGIRELPEPVDGIYSRTDRVRTVSPQAVRYSAALAMHHLNPSPSFGQSFHSAGLPTAVRFDHSFRGEHGGTGYHPVAAVTEHKSVPYRPAKPVRLVVAYGVDFSPEQYLTREHGSLPSFPCFRLKKGLDLRTQTRTDPLCQDRIRTNHSNGDIRGLNIMTCSF
ncbi:hypothetical protein ZHAS_00022006 [Anopheles sinensis]|uniref:Uncharacterized protein n=1 Tax=Anopheles sinensis TaxID=74873 RepID=A0A084WU78_ANOSI|nr:hypothetical protein ZHAS_00022006 [Anopheles sinensis]